jgi:hypothetical protein
MRPGEKAGLGSFLFEGELEPLDEKDYYVRNLIY